ncbi:MAG: phosphoribosylformylglycinamidine synthase II, partial [Bauldia sp.]
VGLVVERDVAGNDREGESPAFKGNGEAILLAGAPAAAGRPRGRGSREGRSTGRDECREPPVDLGHERRVGDFVRSLVRDRRVTAVHDLSDGGVAVALAEMAMAAGVGAAVDLPSDAAPLAALFGEDQGRYVVTAPVDEVGTLLELAEQAGVRLAQIGATGGGDLKLGGKVAISVAKLKEAHENWFPAFMNG